MPGKGYVIPLIRYLNPSKYKTMRPIIKIAANMTIAQFKLNCLNYRRCKPNICLLIALILVSWMICLSACSQTANSKDENGSWFFSFGNGYSYAGHGNQSKAGGGFSIRTALDYQNNRFVFSTYLSGNQGGKANYDDYLKNNSNSEYLSANYKHELLFDLGFQFGGVALQNKRFDFILMTGISVVMVKQIVIRKDNGSFTSSDFFSYKVDREFLNSHLGVPCDVKVNYKILNDAGIGLCAHANLNPVESFFSISLNLIWDI
jgi:hypothetical protein